MRLAVATIFEKITTGAKLRALRSIRQFAEDEIVLPSGPFQGERFKTDRLPWFKVWFDGIDSGHWRRFALTGPGQAGKTLAGSALPVLWHLFEHREGVVYAAPNLDMAADKWKLDILPLIEASQYRDLLPDTGRGSRGGTALSIQFRHGPTLRFMSGSGRDKVRAGYTSRIVVVTETDGFDLAGETSREADPFSQVEARTAAFGDRARVYSECTTSIEEGRIWRELKAGTDTRLALPCPHCRAFVTPEREHVAGWQDARDANEARAKARLCCPACGSAWSEEDRAAANRGAVAVHRGQKIDGGTIVAIIPETQTFSLRFTSINNLLTTMARVAEEEWTAPRTTDAGLAERKLRQFFWTLPSEPESVTISELDAQSITTRSVDIPRGRVPDDAAKLTVGVDCGKWLHHWVAIAWRPGGTPHVLEYGRLEVASNSMAEEQAILTALRRFRDEVCLVGWPSIGGETIKPNLTLIDSGNWEGVIVTFCSESGAGFLPAKGFAASQTGRARLIRDPGYELIRQPAGHALVEINSDHWKSYLHARIQTPVGQPGGLTLFHASPIEHLSFAKHLTAEKRVEEFHAGRGLISRWEALNRNNHFLDAACLACVAGHGVGETIVQAAPPPPAPTQAQPNTIAPKRFMSRGQKW